MTVTSISRTGIIFVIYFFIVIVSFFVLSAPVDMIWDSFDDSDFGDAEPYKDDLIPNIRIVMKIFWALFVSLPVTWVLMKVFSREPANYYRRR